MAAVFDAISPTDRELEQLWRRFHSAWVRASDEVAAAEERLLELQQRGDAAATHTELLRMLRVQERQCRAMLEQFESRMRNFRSRTAAFRTGYR